MKCPCKDCPNQGCGAYHSKCKDYSAWKKEWDDLKSKERDARLLESSLSRQNRTKRRR